MKFTPVLLAATAALLGVMPAAAQPQPQGQLKPQPGSELRPQAAPDPAAIGHARVIVEKLLSPGRRREITDAMAQNIVVQLRGSILGASPDAGLAKVVDGQLAQLTERLAPIGERHMPAIADAIVMAYARRFSVDELAEIATFAQTPAGTHYFALAYPLLPDPAVNRANQALLDDARQASEAILPQLRAAVAEYLIKHPQVAQQLRAQQQQQQQPPSP